MVSQNEAMIKQNKLKADKKSKSEFKNTVIDDDYDIEIFGKNRKSGRKHILTYMHTIYIRTYTA